MSGNSFNGMIFEIPGISIDKFNTREDVSTYLLTHCHADHLTGLENTNFSGTIYCSPVTKALLSLNKAYSHNMKYVRSVDMNQEIEIQVRTQNIRLRLISSYHCPGSVMFLIETGEKTVLCTGDLRAESWWVKSILNENPYLFQFTTGLKKIDTIYMDTTFGYRGEPYIEMLENSDGVDIVILLLKAYPMEDPDINFCFVDTILGFEEAWSKIVTSFNGTLHVSNELRKRMDVLGGVYQEIARGGGHNSRFHACRKYSECKQPGDSSAFISIRQCINFNAMDFAGVFCPILIDDLDTMEREKGMVLIGSTPFGTKIYRFRDRTWILPRDKRELLSTEIKLIFSRHSSYMESCNFVGKFKPREVYPCVESQESWGMGLQMSRVFGKLCDTLQPPSPLMFRYDINRLSEWGLPLNLRDRPIKVINRWNLVDCQMEMEIAAKFVRSGESKYKFKGQHWTSKFSNPNYSEDDRHFDLARKKDYHLQNVIIARGERKYKKIIQDFQDLYRNVHIDKGRNYATNQDFNERDLHVTGEGGIKLGGLDRYNYDVDSDNTGDTNQSSNSDINEMDTDLDEGEGEDDELVMEREPTIGVPSQMMEVGDFLVFKRLGSSLEGGPSLKRQDTTSFKCDTLGSFRLSFQILVHEPTDIENSDDSNPILSPIEKKVTEISTDIKSDNPKLDENLIQSVYSKLEENPVSWLGIGLKSVKKDTYR